MSITLSHDGTFQLVNIPDCWNNIEKQKGNFLTQKGTWALEKQDKFWIISLASHLPNNVTEGYFFQLKGEKAPYTLSLGVGDPDHGEAMKFEMKPSSKK